MAPSERASALYRQSRMQPAQPLHPQIEELKKCANSGLKCLILTKQKTASRSIRCRCGLGDLFVVVVEWRLSRNAISRPPPSCLRSYTRPTTIALLSKTENGEEEDVRRGSGYKRKRGNPTSTSGGVAREPSARYYIGCFNSRGNTCDAYWIGQVPGCAQGWAQFYMNEPPVCSADLPILPDCNLPQWGMIKSKSN